MLALFCIREGKNPTNTKKIFFKVDFMIFSQAQKSDDTDFRRE